MPVINIFNGTIDNVSRDRGSTLVTVTYSTGSGNRRRNETVVLVVGPRTIIVNTNGERVAASSLSPGMTINATISSAMTRSIPPQSNAFFIKILRRSRRDNVTVGRNLDIDQRNRSFTTISDLAPSTIIRFNVPDDAVILDRQGRPINFSRLSSGMRVRVRHANFMTASIPPQTTAFEVRVL